jgi:hypothetical protein
MTKKGLCLSGLLCIIQSGSHRTRRILRSETQDKEWSGGIQTMGNGLSVRTQTMVGESRFFTSPRPSPLVAGGRKRFGKSRFMLFGYCALAGLGCPFEIVYTAGFTRCWKIVPLRGLFGSIIGICSNASPERAIFKSQGCSPWS